jgi:hypothetical protein
MSGHPGATEVLLLSAAVPGCVPLMAGLGMALAASALLLSGWLLRRLLRALRARLGVPEPLDSPHAGSAESDRRVEPQMPGQTRRDVATRLRHDSPGGWTAGETRWTLAHEQGWFNSPSYRTFLLVVVVVSVAWAYGTAFAHQYCG